MSSKQNDILVDAVIDGIQAILMQYNTKELSTREAIDRIIDLVRKYKEVI